MEYSNKNGKGQSGHPQMFAFVVTQIEKINTLL